MVVPREKAKFLKTFKAQFPLPIDTEPRRRISHQHNQVTIRRCLDDKE